MTSFTVRRAIAALPHGAWLLAVSGGRDSMALLDAFATAGRRDVRGVATFDHGTGEAARRAAGLVARVAASHGLPFVTAQMDSAAGSATEADWRDARWRFLAGWAREFDATVVTAHTRDDQVETIAFRILRGAGARGLAGMSPESPGRPPIVRPFLGIARSGIDAYMRSAGAAYIDDPSNHDRRHARNRLRHDLLPALERAQPGFGDWLLDLGRRAGAWRREVEALLSQLEAAGQVQVRADGSIVVRTAPFALLGPADWSVLWPAFAARAGLALDRRGLRRASEWAAVVAGTREARGTIQLARGGEIERTSGAFVLRRR